MLTAEGFWISSHYSRPEIIWIFGSYGIAILVVVYLLIANWREPWDGREILGVFSFFIFSPGAVPFVLAVLSLGVVFVLPVSGLNKLNEKRNEAIERKKWVEDFKLEKLRKYYRSVAIIKLEPEPEFDPEQALIDHWDEQFRKRHEPDA